MPTAHPRFEDRLLAQLRSIVAERPAPDTAPVPVARSPRHAPRRLRIVALGAAAAATATVATIVAGGGDVAAPAYAVIPHANGSVTVHIDSLRDADGLQGKLRDAGIPAVVSYDADAKACSSPPAGAGQNRFYRHSSERGTQSGSGPSKSTDEAGAKPALAPLPQLPGGPNRRSLSSQVIHGPDGVTFTVDPGTIPSGEHLFITTAGGGSLESVGMSIGKTAEACTVPPPPAG